MEEVIKQIRQGIDANMYMLCLYTTLTLPDIAGAIDSTDGNAKRAKYEAWYNKHVLPQFSDLTAEECYSFRCRALHQGRSEPHNPSSAYNGIGFIEPGIGGPNLSVHKMIIGGEPGPRIIDIVKFIEAVLTAFEEWLKSSNGSEPFDTNYSHCIQKHPNGLKPYIDGVPFIF